MTKEEYDTWFRQIWNLTGASTRGHPAPFPAELAYRLVRMFSFVGDTVLDPFSGSGTTMVAAMKCGRNSVGIELDPAYCRQSAHRLRDECASLFSAHELHFRRAEPESNGMLVVREELRGYRAPKDNSGSNASVNEIEFA